MIFRVFISYEMSWRKCKFESDVKEENRYTVDFFS